jgi:hypothetical protein
MVTGPNVLDGAGAAKTVRARETRVKALKSILEGGKGQKVVLLNTIVEERLLLIHNTAHYIVPIALAPRVKDARIPRADHDGFEAAVSYIEEEEKQEKHVMLGVLLSEDKQ